jgi:D-alanine-D-alanine ligase
LIVKPLYEGSSIGIRNDSLVKSRREMRERVLWLLNNYNEPALVEEFLPGREFTIAILGNGSGARVLPIVEILFDSLPKGVNPIYSYEAKWIWDQSSNPLKIFECPARLSAELHSEIESVCLRAYNILRCRDWCRIDVRLDASGRPHILELNPLPGILPGPEENSCFPKAARAAGMSYRQLIHTVLDIACKRNGLA